LKIDDTFTGAQLFLRKYTLVLFGGLGSKEWAGPFGVQVASAAESHEALCNLWQIASLIKINSLEHIDVRYSVCFASLLETIDILHLFELAARGVDFGDTSWHQLVHQFAEDNSITKNVFEWTISELLTENSLNPGKDFGFKGGITFAGKLKATHKKGSS